MFLPDESTIEFFKKLPAAYAFIAFFIPWLVHLVVKQRNINRTNIKWMIWGFLSLSALVIFLDLYVKPFILCN